MTKIIKLEASVRDEKNDLAKKIRKNGFIPAVIYGPKQANQNLKIKKLDFEKVFQQAGEFNLIDLQIDEQPPIKAIIKEVQKDIIKDQIIHADFYQVEMSKKIVTQIPLNFVGQSKAVKELGGTLVKNMDNIEVRCLPSDLISHIDIDVSKLDTFADLIRLADLKLPTGLELVSDTNEVVVMVSQPKAKEEKPAVAVPAEVAAAAAAETAASPEQTQTPAAKAETKKE